MSRKRIVESKVSPPVISDQRNSANGSGKLVQSAKIDGTIIDVNNRDRLLFQLWGEINPSQLGNILKQALIGNLVWQERLFQKMLDEWPRLQKNMLSLKRDVANLPWSIEPFSEKGGKATTSAQDKAELVERALFNMVGDPTLDQSDWSGTIKDIVDAIAQGFNISEIHWTTRDGEIVPQCTRKLPARYYGYSLMPEMPDQLMLNPLGNLAFTWNDLTHFPDNKFIIGIFKGYSNHPTVAAMLRSLTPYWFAQKYGLKWFMTFCQLFGTPMRMAEYTPGDVTTFNALCSMLEQMGQANWGVFPAGAKVELLESKAANGTMIPQRVLASDADEVCDIIILGQTLTSQVRSSGGNRALGQVHADTERKVLNGVADFVKTVINNQLIPSILQLNYGETSESPTLEGSLEEPTDELALAQRDLIVVSQMGLPVAKDFLYERHSIPEPAEDAELYSPPSIGPDAKLGSLEPPPPPPLPAGAVPPPGGSAPNPDGPAKKAGTAPVKAAYATLVPSMQMAVAAKRGLALRVKHGRGGSLSAVARARDISQRNGLHKDHAKRMQIYFDAHPEDANAPAESAGGIAYQLHGGHAGKSWVAQMLKGQT